MLPPVTTRTCTLLLLLLVNHDNTVHGDYGGVSCDVTGTTYNSVLTVHVVSAGVPISGCRHVGELLLGAGEGVHLDSGERRVTPASSHHNPVLEFNGTSIAENEDDNNINIYND